MIYCDNQSYIKLSENPIFHDNSKHIDIKYHYVRELIEKQVIQLEYLQTDRMLADGLTKPLGPTKYQAFIDFLGFDRLTAKPTN